MLGKLPMYTDSHKPTAKLQTVTCCLILRAIYCINTGSNLNHHVVNACSSTAYPLVLKLWTSHVSRVYTHQMVASLKQGSWFVSGCSWTEVPVLWAIMSTEFANESRQTFTSFIYSVISTKSTWKQSGKQQHISAVTAHSITHKYQQAQHMTHSRSRENTVHGTTQHSSTAFHSTSHREL